MRSHNTIRIKFFTIFSCVLLALSCFSVIGITLAEPAGGGGVAAASGSAYADRAPTAAELAAIGYRIDPNGMSMRWDTGCVVNLDGRSVTVAYKSSVTINALRYRAADGTDHSVFAYYWVVSSPGLPSVPFLATRFDDNHGDMYSSVAAEPSMSRQMDYGIPQSLNSLRISNGRISYTFVDHTNTSHVYYLSSTGFTPKSEEAAVVSPERPRPKDYVRDATDADLTAYGFGFTDLTIQLGYGQAYINGTLYGSEYTAGTSRPDGPNISTKALLNNNTTGPAAGKKCFFMTQQDYVALGAADDYFNATYGSVRRRMYQTFNNPVNINSGSYMPRETPKLPLNTQLEQGTASLYIVTTTKASDFYIDTHNRICYDYWDIRVDNQPSLQEARYVKTYYLSKEGGMVTDPPTEVLPPLSDTIALGDIGKTFGDSAFELSLSNPGKGSGAVTYRSSNPNIAAISGTTCTIKGAGSVTISAMKAGDANYLSANTSCKLTISPKAGAGLSIDCVSEMVYTGTELKPKPVVKDNGTLLTEGKDYDLTYGGNIIDATAGRGRVTITFKGNYSGSTYKDFSIKPADIASAGVTLSQSEYTYTGAALKPTATLQFNGKTLALNTDYTLTYNGNVNAGTGKVIITGKGNFAGYTKEAPFSIKPADIASAGVTLSQSEYTYTGAALKPTATLQFNGKTLVLNTDYTLTYNGNVNAGTGKVIITGKGNFAGYTKEVPFTIKPADIASAGVTLSQSEYTYTGAALKPTATLQFNGKTLTLNTDYTLTYADYVNAGTGKVIITGIGNFDGYTKEVSFTINKAAQVFTPSGNTMDALSGSLNISPSGSKAATEYSSSDGRVAGVDSNGKITAGNKAGSAVITIKNPGDGNYLAYEKTVSVTTRVTDGFFTGSLDGDNTVYPTLQDAVNGVQNGNAVYVIGNPTVSDTATVKDKNVILKGDGDAALSRKDFTGNILSVASGAALTVENLKLDGKNVLGDSLILSSGELTLGSGAQFTGGMAENGGAVRAEAGSLKIKPGTSFKGNTASGNGGAVYIADNVTAEISGGVMSNNSAKTGKAIYIDNADITLDGRDCTAGITDSIGIGGAGKITLANGLTHTISVEFASPSTQMSAQAPYKNYVESGASGLSGAQMKEYLRVVNAGYTFNGEAVKDALVLQESKIEAARFIDSDGTWHSYFDLQSAIDAAAELGESVTIQLVQYINDKNTTLNSDTVELASGVSIPDGADITFSSIVKHTDSTGAQFKYETAKTPTIVKRADNLTGAMIQVESGAKLTLGDVILDGGADWENGTPVIEDDKNGGAGTVVTNNNGVTAHAPVIVNGGTLSMGKGATIRNNDNNYAKPGEGFGSQNYGGGVRNEGAGKFDMTGGVIENCYSREGGAVMNVNKPGTPGYVEGGEPTVTISGGNIRANVSQKKGAAVQTIYGGAKSIVTGEAAIENNYSLYDLGALAVEEGGALSVTGGKVVKDTDNSNAIYIYNRYSEKDYSDAATKPYIEGKGAAQFTVSGAPEITGKIFLDNPCIVVGTATEYHPIVELKDYTGTESKLEVVLDDNRAYGKTVTSNSGNLSNRVSITEAGFDTEYKYADRYIYTSADDKEYIYGGYDFDIDQTEPGKLSVKGVCDGTIANIKVQIGGTEKILEVSGGIIDNVIDLSDIDGVSFEAVVKMTDKSGQVLSDKDLSMSLNVIKFNPETGEIEGPEGAEYLDGNGEYKSLEKGTLPNGIAVDAKGDATFKVGGTTRVIHIGERAADITDEELPLTDGSLNDLTDTLITIEGEDGYEYNLIDESGKIVGEWKGVDSPAGNTVVFDNLKAGSYTVAVRRSPVISSDPNQSRIPGAYRTDTGKSVTMLSTEEAAAKKAFEDDYAKIKDSLLQSGGAEPTAAAEDILKVIDKYNTTLTGIAQVPGLPGIRDKIAHLEESYDHALANEWKEANKEILEKGKAPDSLKIADKAAADSAIDEYGALPGDAKALVTEEYKRLVETKKTIAGLEVEEGVDDWTLPGQANEEELRAIADKYLAEIAAKNENTENVKVTIDDITDKVLALLEVRGKYDELLNQNSNLTEKGKEALKNLLDEKLALLESAAASDVERVTIEANAAIKLQWQKELAVCEYDKAFEAIKGRTPNPDETKAVQDAIEAEGDLPGINSVFGEAVKELLDGTVTSKDSAETAGIVETIKTAVESAKTSATETGAVMDIIDEVKDIRTDLQTQRESEKTAAKEELDSKAKTILDAMSERNREEAERLIDEAKAQIDVGEYEDYPLFSQKALSKLAVLERLDEILTNADKNGYTGTDDLITAKDAAYGKIDTAADIVEAKTEEKEGILVLDREEGILILKNILSENDSQAVVDLVTGVGGAESKLDAAGDKAEVDAIVEAAKNAITAGRFKDEHEMRRPFEEISKEDLEPLKDTRKEYDTLDDAVKDVLDKEAQDAGYTDYGKLLDDSIKKAEFEIEKDEIIVRTNTLVREHDGDRVREILAEELEKIGDVVYQPHTQDATRDDYYKERVEALGGENGEGGAFGAARVEIEHSQKQQRTENSLELDLEERFDSGQYNDTQKGMLEDLLSEAKEAVDGVASGNTDELDRILAETEAAFGDVPVTSVAKGDIKPDKTPASSAGTGDYSEGGTPDEIWGIVTNDESMPGGVKLVIEKSDNDAIKAINKATKEGKIAAAEGSTLTEEETKTLVEGKEIKSTLDIYLLQGNVKITQFDGKYLVKILMTPELRSMEGLQIVYVADDGSVQVYKTTIEDGKYLVFTTTHFSEFFIMGEKVFNLWWLIILFAVLIVIEAVIVFLSVRRNKKNNKDNKSGKTEEVKLNSFTPMLLSAILLPNGALAACITLGVLAVAGAGAAAATAIKASRNAAKRQEQQSVSEEQETDIIPVAPAARSTEAPAAAPVIVPEAKVKPVVVPIPVIAPKTKNKPAPIDNQTLIVIQYRKSFTAKLIQSEETVKNYYSELKNEIMAYGVKSRTSWRGETFRKGKKLVRMQFKGKVLALSFALSPSDYAGTKYKVDDMSDVESGKDLPCVYRIRNARRAVYAKTLIANVMSAEGLSRKEIAAVDYKTQFPYEETDALIERGLIKILTEEPGHSGTTFRKEDVRASVSVTEAASLMHDEAAAALVEEDSRIADKTKTDIVNIDTLGRCFEAGERVTLEEMKKRIPALNKKTTYIKVLARGTLDKTLIVEADDFSLDAVKMILLTGGQVKRSRRV